MPVKLAASLPLINELRGRAARVQPACPESPGPSIANSATSPAFSYCGRIHAWPHSSRSSRGHDVAEEQRHQLADIADQARHIKIISLLELC